MRESTPDGFPCYPALGHDPVAVGVREVPPAPPVPDLGPVPDWSSFPTVTRPSDEPLVPVRHRRVLVTSSYWHWGWEHAVPGAFLRADVAARLGRAAERLPEPFGIAVHDAWRPLALQRELYDHYDARGAAVMLSPPSTDPQRPPPHLTGGTADVTLTWRGIPLVVGTEVDAVHPDALPHALEDRPGVHRDLRRLLTHVMTAEGFVVEEDEWWHFEHGTARWARTTGGVPRYGPAPAPDGVQP